MRRAASILTAVAIIIAAVILALTAFAPRDPHSTQRVYHTPLGVSPHAPGFGRPPPSRLGLSPPTAARGVPTVEMFDTITLSTVPPNPLVLAGYTAGYWPTYLPLVRSYPHAKVKSIAIAAGYYSDCLDIEPGDANPSQAGAWYWADRAHGFARPCEYASLSTWPTIRYYLARARVPRQAILEFDADYTYRQHLDAGFDATQWTDRALGRNLDESTVTLTFAGLPAPKPTPAPRHRPRPVGAAQIARWTRERTDILAAYHAAGCRPHSTGRCARLAAREHRLHADIKRHTRSLP